LILGVLRRVPVKPNANSIQFSLQQSSLLSTFRSIKDHQNQITRLPSSANDPNPINQNQKKKEKEKKTNLSGRNNLPPTSLPLSSTLNDTRQIQNLDLSTPILQHTRDSRERGKRVRRGFTLSLGDFGQESGFTDGGETDEGYSCITALAYVEAGTPSAAAAGRFEELGP